MDRCEVMFAFGLIGIATVLQSKGEIDKSSLQRYSRHSTNLDEESNNIDVTFERSNDQRRDLSDGCAALFVKNFTVDAQV